MFTELYSTGMSFHLPAPNTFHRFDLECPPDTSVTKGLVLRVRLLGGGATFREWGLVGGHSVVGGVPKGHLGILTPSCFIFLATKGTVLLCPKLSQ